MTNIGHSHQRISIKSVLRYSLKLGMGVLILLLAACNVQMVVPGLGDEPKIDTQADFVKQFGGTFVASLSNGRSSLALDNNNNPVLAFDNNGFILVNRWDGSNWIPFGTNVNANPFAKNPSLVLDNSGNPVVAWQESNGFIYVNGWNGNSWIPFGANVNANPAATNPSLILDTSGNPVIGWQESDGYIYVNRWNGSVWLPLGTNINSGSGKQPSIALNGAGDPIVSWSEYVGVSNSIYVRVWNSSTNTWQPYGNEFQLDVNLNTDSSQPSLVTYLGNPIVAWTEFDGNSTNIYVKRFSQTTLTWQLLGGGPIDNLVPYNTRTPSLAVDSSGNPVVIWVEKSGKYFQKFGKRWNGSNWDKLIIPLESSSSISPKLTLDGLGMPIISHFQDSQIFVGGYYQNAFRPLGSTLDRAVNSDVANSSIALENYYYYYPVIAWTEGSLHPGSSIYVSRYTQQLTGESWDQLPAVNFTGTGLENGRNPSLAIEKPSNVFAFNPVVAYSERLGSTTTTDYIYVKRWDGTTWVQLGNALNRANTNNATEPSLALAGNNRPYVAWVEVVNGSRNLYVKRWNGTTWVWVGGTAALDIGLANYVGKPSLAIGSDNIPVVAWAEENAGSSNIYVKRLVGTTWTLVGTTAIDRSISQYAESPSLDLDSNNNPIVAWSEFFISPVINSWSVTAKRWDSVTNTWIGLGVLLDKSALNNAYTPSLSVRTDNNPVVSWSEVVNGSQNIYVKRWDSATSRWVLISTGALDNVLSQTAEKPSLVLNAANNPIVAWQESTTSQQRNIYVKGF